jgi:hypothetical protein
MSTETITEAKPSKLIVQDNSAISYLMDTGKFEHCYRIAKLMATASLIPDHLKFTGNASNKRELTAEEKIGNCFMIVNQAIRWGIDPWSMAPETYVVGGKLAFQGKLVAAVVNGLANLEERLSYTFSGPPGSDDFTITVSGKIRGETEPRTVSVRVGSVKTDNQMWKKDPEQKLVYTGATKWARRHCPEVILGIIVDDEIEEVPMRDVTPRDTAPPKVITGGTTPPTAAEVTKTSRKTKAEPAATVEATEATPAASTTIPVRPDMVTAIRTAYRAAGIKNLSDAESKARAAGFLEPEKGFSSLADSDMFRIYQNLATIFPPAETEPLPVVRAFYQNHKVTRSAEGVSPAWTMHRLVYQVAGEDDVKEAVTFSKTIQATLDTLEGAEALLLTVKSTDKGDQIETLELAQKVGGAA